LDALLLLGGDRLIHRADPVLLALNRLRAEQGVPFFVALRPLAI
jgi:hypothetical protein